MKHIFSVTLRKISMHATYYRDETYEVVASTAKQAIDKATTQFKKDEGWGGGVLVESLKYRGPAV